MHIFQGQQYRGMPYSRHRSSSLELMLATQLSAQSRLERERGMMDNIIAVNAYRRSTDEATQSTIASLLLGLRKHHLNCMNINHWPFALLL